MLTRSIAAGSAAMVTALITMTAIVLTGCGPSAADANQRQLQDQQAQLDQLKQEVAALQNSHSSYNTAPVRPGSCDTAVMAAATRKGGDRMAAGDTTTALGFYQDAVTACSASAAAQLNLANTYEAIGDRAEAIEHYRIAAAATGPDADAAAVGQAREALNRLGASS
jgi:tetratricopeptide (TPR) repeat protein